jgi:transposase
MEELQTAVTNKEAKGKKRAIIAGTKSETVINHLQRTSFYKRNQVVEITLDMPNSMKSIARNVFPTAQQVTDRFTYKVGLNFRIRTTAPLNSGSETNFRSSP